MVTKIDIHRVHVVDLDVVLFEGETIEEACGSLTDGLLVTWTVLMKAGPSGHPLVRFTGIRVALEALIDRYEGSGSDAKI